MSAISPGGSILKVNSAPTSILNSGPAGPAASLASFESKVTLPIGRSAVVRIRSIVWVIEATPEASTDLTVQVMSMVRVKACLNSWGAGSLTRVGHRLGLDHRVMEDLALAELPPERGRGPGLGRAAAARIRAAARGARRVAMGELVVMGRLARSGFRGPPVFDLRGQVIAAGAEIRGRIPDSGGTADRVHATTRGRPGPMGRPARGSDHQPAPLGPRAGRLRPGSPAGAGGRRRPRCRSARRRWPARCCRPS